MRASKLLPRALASSALSLIALASPAGAAQLAQPTPDAGDQPPAPEAAPEPVPSEASEEIVVTARLRNETLMETPVAISVINAATLQNYATNDVRDIARLAPSLIIDRNGSGAGGTIALRGVSTSPNQAGFDQAVSLNVDGVQTSRGRALTLGFFDVDQVQVLRGPQALFFGKNSPGGVISLTSAGPTSELSGYVRAGYEFNGAEAIVDGAISGPLGGDVGARLALRYRNLDGFFTNIAGPVTVVQPGDPGPPTLATRRPGDEEFLGRLTLSYEPAGGPFDATFRLAFSELTGDGPYGGAQVYFCGNQPAGVTGGVLDPYGECKFDRFYSSSALADGVADNWAYARQQPYTESSYYMGSLVANYRFSDDITLTSTTGYIRSRTSYSDNFDASSLYRIGAAEHEENDTFSQELRLLSSFDAPVNFMLGAYYQQAEIEFINNTRAVPLGRDPATGQYETWNKLGTMSGTTYSVFGQLLWDINDQLELAGGVRYTREERLSTLRNTYVHPPLAGVAFLSPAVTLTNDYAEGNWSPEATLTWRPTTDITAYFAYKTGFKSGGFAFGAVLSPGTARASDFDYSAETVEGFEGGLRLRLADRRMLLSAAVYSYNYDGLQVNALDATTFSFTIQNAASATVKGFELEGSFRANENFSLRSALSYNRARYSEFLSACYSGQNIALGCSVSVAPGPDGISGTADDVRAQDRSGQPLARAPEWTFNVGADVTLPVGQHLVLGGSLDTRYTSDYAAIDNGHPGGIIDSFWTIDASVRVGAADDRWELALIGRNLTDEYYTAYLTEKPGGFVAPGQPIQLQGIPMRGRQVMLQGTFRF